MPRSALEEYQEGKDLTQAGKRTLIVGGDNPIRISSGHRILHHEGRCSRPHGHNYEISVEVTGTLTEEGWVVDKANVTDIIDDWDHKFLVEDGDPLIEAFEVSGDGEALVVFDHPPTVEVMAFLLEDRLLDELPDTVSEVSVTVQETGELSVS